jgi:VWFA-related protein
MKKCLAQYLIVILIGILAIPVASNAGDADGQDAPGAIKVEVHLIEVYATVFDQKGHYLDGLSRDNFQVSEDGRSQEIASFETGAQSLSCAILLDTTGSMSEALPRVKNSIMKLIDELGPQDSVAIYTFDERLAARQEFTTDKDAAKRAVLRTRAQGRTALFDALSQTAQEISKRPGKKVLVVFTDGDDNSSALNASSAISRAKKVGVPLYAIAEGEAVKSKNLKKLLEDMSQRTGGSTYQVNKAGDIDNVFQSIAQSMQHLYMISYQPPSNSAGDQKWRSIEVALKGVKEYRIRAKEGYFPE